jgi:hypothetical protein
MSYLFQINSFLLLLDTITLLNFIQKVIENAEINKELNE